MVKHKSRRKSRKKSRRRSRSRSRSRRKSRSRKSHLKNWVKACKAFGYMKKGLYKPLPKKGSNAYKKIKRDTKN